MHSNHLVERDRSISSRSGEPAVQPSLERLEERPPDEELRFEDAATVADVAAGLAQPDLEHLARVVPLVDRVRDVEALVALEPDEPAAEARGEDLGQLRLADPRLTLEEQRPAELEGQEDGGRQRAVAEVVPGTERAVRSLSMERVSGLARSFRDGRSLHVRPKDRRGCQCVNGRARGAARPRHDPGRRLIRRSAETDACARLIVVAAVLGQRFARIKCGGCPIRSGGAQSSRDHWTGSSAGSSFRGRRSRTRSRPLAGSRASTGS